MLSKAKGAPPDSDHSATGPVTSSEDKAKARKWFVRARELGDKRQFEYAIEYYVNGLEFWPDAVEDACKPLHGCAVARRQTGGKKPGLKDTMRRSVTDKDAKKALMNAAWLFGHDPDNLQYIEGFARNASKLGATASAKWAAGVCLKGLETNPKASSKQFQGLVELLEEIGDHAAADGNGALGTEVFQMAVDTLSLWQRRLPRDRQPEERMKNLSTKLTILKGKYKDSGSFRDSIVDREEQEELHDRHRSVQADERVDELIVKAEEEYRTNPNDGRALNTLIELLTRREHEPSEAKAIGILVEEFKRTGEYGRKQLADDIRMKQLNRAVRLVGKSGDAEAVKEHQLAALRFEMGVFKERLERYPTDNRVKFEYAVRLFRAGRFDDAIPLFQTARVDPKNKTACALYLGRCFYRKAYHSQAISTLAAEVERYEVKDDDLAKSMLYWLGRSHEDAQDVAAARNTYGRILQLDYNFKDVRERLDRIPG